MDIPIGNFEHLVLINRFPTIFVPFLNGFFLASFGICNIMGNQGIEHAFIILTDTQ